MGERFGCIANDEGDGQWTVSGLWAFGILVGVDLLMTGISLIALASTLSRLKKLTREVAAN